MSKDHQKFRVKKDWTGSGLVHIPYLAMHKKPPASKSGETLTIAFCGHFGTQAGGSGWGIEPLGCVPCWGEFGITVIHHVSENVFRSDVIHGPIILDNFWWEWLDISLQPRPYRVRNCAYGSAKLKILSVICDVHFFCQSDSGCVVQLAASDRGRRKRCRSWQPVVVFWGWKTLECTWLPFLFVIIDTSFVIHDNQPSSAIGIVVALEEFFVIISIK